MHASNSGLQSDQGISMPPPPPGLGYNHAMHGGGNIPGNDLVNSNYGSDSRLDRYNNNIINDRFERNLFQRPDGGVEDNNNIAALGGTSYGMHPLSKEKIKNITDDTSVGSDYDLQRTQYNVIPPSAVGTPSSRNKIYGNQQYGKGHVEIGSGNIPSYSNPPSSSNSYYLGQGQGQPLRAEEPQPVPRNQQSFGYNQNSSYYSGNNSSSGGGNPSGYSASDSTDYAGQMPLHHQHGGHYSQQQQQQYYQQQQGKGMPSANPRISFMESQMMDDDPSHPYIQQQQPQQPTPTHMSMQGNKPPLPYHMQAQYKQQAPQTPSQLQQQYGRTAQPQYTNHALSGGRENMVPHGSQQSSVTLPSPSNRMGYPNQGPAYNSGYPQAGLGQQHMGSGGIGSGGSGMIAYSPKHSGGRTPPASGTGGSNAQGRAINKMLLDILRERVIDPVRLELAIETYTERMDCVNVATLLFHTGKKRLLLSPAYINRIANRLSSLKEELRAREASNALYGLKCMSSDVPEVKELVLALAHKLSSSTSEFLAQAVGNALYGCQMMTSDHEEVRQLLHVLAVKVAQCTELLEAQNVGNALYGLRGMNSDHKEVRAVINALTPKIATAREDLNGQALGNSLYGLQSMSSKEPEVRSLLAVLATKVSRTWEELKAQEVGNALYGLKRMSTEVPEVRFLIAALVPKVASSPEILDAQAIGNSFYGLQNMQSDSVEVLQLLQVMAQKVALSSPELDGQAMGNSLYGLQGMSSDYPEVRAVVKALTAKLHTSGLEMNAQELGNAIYGLQNMTSEHLEVRRLIAALTQKVISSKHDLTSQEIGNAMFGLQGMSSAVYETRMLVKQLAIKIQQSHSVLDPQGVSNSLFGIQRMSSDSDEVRALVQALANKIEHSWKLLSAQHLSNALFGVQCLCSSEKETRYLLHVMHGKIVSCRDEMSAKQLSYALFGLRNMNSDHAEVLKVVSALADKVATSTDSWSLQFMSMAIFGMQGMNSDADEVALLLNALLGKCATIDFSSGDREFNFKMLSNLLFGMQRMSSNSLNVSSILKCLPAVLTTTVSYKVPMENQLFTPSMCANILFGLQGCSCTNQSVGQILRFVSQSIKSITASAKKDVNRLSQAGDPFIQPSQSQSQSQPTGRSAVRGLDADYSFEELLCLYQSLILSIFAMTDLAADTQLHNELHTHATHLYAVIESRLAEFMPKPLSIVESHLVQEVAAKLSAEPFEVTAGSLMFGFEMAVFVSLPTSVPLMTLSGAEWSPKLNLEVQGSSYNSPTKALFYNLRNQFLLRERGVAIVSIPVESFRDGGSRLVSALHHCPNAFEALYPPSSEDAEAINQTLISIGLLPASGVLMGTITSTFSEYSAAYDASGYLTNQQTRARTRQGQGGDPYQQDGSENLSVEYLDDDFHTANVQGALAANETKKGIRVLVSSNRSPRNRRPMGIYMGWLGAWPTVLFSGYCVSPLSISNPAAAEGGRYGNRFNSPSGDIASPNLSVGSNSMQGTSPYQGYQNMVRGGGGGGHNKTDRRDPANLGDESNLSTTPAEMMNDKRFKSGLNLSLNLSLLQPKENQPVQTPSMPFRSHYEDEEGTPSTTPSSYPRVPAYNSYERLASPVGAYPRPVSSVALARPAISNTISNVMSGPPSGLTGGMIGAAAAAVTPMASGGGGGGGGGVISTSATGAAAAAMTTLSTNSARSVNSDNDDTSSIGSGSLTKGINNHNHHHNNKNEKRVQKQQQVQQKAKLAALQHLLQEGEKSAAGGDLEGGSRSGDADGDADDDDDEIAILEAKLEVARLEARIKSLKKAKALKAKAAQGQAVTGSGEANQAASALAIETTSDIAP